MLSKRFNDILFVLILVVAVAGVFLMRFLLLGNIDSRIDSTVSDNNSMETRINELTRLVDQHGQETLPSMTEMHRFIPHDYDRDQLLFYIMAQLEFSGVSDVTDFNRRVTITENPAFPEGTEFRAMSNQLDAYRIQIQFNDTDLDRLHTFLEQMDDADQYFILQSIQYDLPTGQTVTFTINYVTFYRP